MNKVITATGLVILSASIFANPITSVVNQQLKAHTAIASNTLSGRSVAAAEDKAQRFKDVPASHWAWSAVDRAVTEGYVSGYSDGTFKPNAAVTRAEFLTVLYKAMHLETPEVATNPWYNQAVTAVKNYKFLDSKDFAKGDYNTQMSRIEMVKVAVRAIGQQAGSDNQFMLLAVKAGLISGDGNKGLNPQGTVTRGAAVTIMQNVLRVNGGEELPVNQAALKEAQANMTKAYDPWGREIRTTNLPKNADKYEYILKDVPNAAYDMPFIAYGIEKYRQTPLQAYNNQNWFPKARVDRSAQNVEDFYNALFNVDYKTIDSAWVDKIVSLMSMQGTTERTQAGVRAVTEAYVERVKAGRLVLKGEFSVEPSMIYNDGSSTYFRGRFEVHVVQGDLSMFSAKDRKPLLCGQTSDISFYGGTTKKDYAGYADIAVTAKYANGGDFFTNTSSDLTSNFVFIQK
ncbi:S-layer homology domain-containing protein [Gorillibacterium timonense]|uniref:S-layer homology domain-containing protein n=1 Tax=Gorillibacterium timonense TaxID=1689269 RepID=UPI00071D4FEF|nr:S-layer homology domain-containing protein [Gorillibacterium timonense]